MNPNNDAYWYDQAKRGSGWDSDEAGCPAGRSASQSRRDRLLERSHRNEAGMELARAEFRKVELSYGMESLPLAIAREEFEAAEKTWHRTRNGDWARDKARAIWAAALMDPVGLKAEEETFWWVVDGVSREEAERVCKLAAEAGAEWDAAKSAIESRRLAAPMAVERAERACLDFEERNPNWREWDDETVEDYSCLLERCKQAEWQDQDHDGSCDEAEREAAVRSEEAQNAYVEAYAVKAVADARAEWLAAKRTWVAAQRANGPARARLEAAEKERDRAQEAYGAERKTIELMLRRR